MTWDGLKPILRGFLVLKSAYLKWQKQQQGQLLHQAISDLECQHKQTGSKTTYKKLLVIWHQLELLESTDLQKGLLLLKQKTWLRSPKALKLQKYRLRRKAASSRIPCIQDSSGKNYSKTLEIKRVLRDYYYSLYTSLIPDQTLIDHFLTDNLRAKLSTEQEHLLEQPFTVEELLKSVKTMKSQKSPGPDRYPTEFYKKFTDLLLEPLGQTCKPITGCLLPSWTQAVVTLIPKDTFLLNMDCKRFTATLKAHLNSFLHQYIHPDPRGFIPGRDLIENTHRALNYVLKTKTKIQA